MHAGAGRVAGVLLSPMAKLSASNVRAVSWRGLGRESGGKTLRAILVKE